MRDLAKLAEFLDKNPGITMEEVIKRLVETGSPAIEVTVVGVKEEPTFKSERLWLDISKTPAITITNALLAEIFISRAHDSVIDLSDNDLHEFAENSRSISFHNVNDMVMQCLSNFSLEALKRIKDCCRNFNFNSLCCDADENYNDYYLMSLPDEGKILYAIVDAVQKRVKGMDLTQSGSWTTEKVLDTFWISINVHIDDEGKPYMAMDTSFLNGEDGEGCGW